MHDNFRFTYLMSKFLILPEIPRVKSRMRNIFPPFIYLDPILMIGQGLYGLPCQSVR